MRRMPESFLFEKAAALDLDAKVRESRSKARLLQRSKILDERLQIFRVQHYSAAHLIGTIPVVMPAFIEKEKIAHSS